MPVIPMMNQSQVLNPSSPVPIGNANTAMESAMNKLGEGMVKLGNELDRVQKEQRARTDKESVKIALADYWAEQNDFNQNRLFSDQNKTLTGLEAIKAMRENGDGVRQKYLEERGFNQEQQLMFIAGSKDADNNFTPDIMKKSAEIGKANYEATRQDYLLKAAGLAASNPEKWDEYMVDIEADNATNPTILNPVETTRKEQIVFNQAAINESVRLGKYDTAKAVLDQAVKRGLYTPEESSKAFNEILSAQRGTAAERRSEINFENSQVDRDWQLKNRGAKQQLSQMLADAGSDQSKINAAFKWADSNIFLSGDDRVSAREWSQKTTQVTDDAYEISFRNELMKPGADFRAIGRELLKDAKTKNISFDRVTKMQSLLDEADNFARNNPQTTATVGAYRNLLKSQFAPSALDPAAQFWDAEKDKNAATAVAYFDSLLFDAAKGGKQLTSEQIKALYARAANKSGLSDISRAFSVGGTSPQDFKDSKSADEVIKKLDIKMRSENKTMTTQEKRENLKRRQQAVQNRNILRQQEKLRLDNPASVNPGKAFDDK